MSMLFVSFLANSISIYIVAQSKNLRGLVIYTSVICLSVTENFMAGPYFLQKAATIFFLVSFMWDNTQNWFNQNLLVC